MYLKSFYRPVITTDTPKEKRNYLLLALDYIEAIEDELPEMAKDNDWLNDDIDWLVQIILDNVFNGKWQDHIKSGHPVNLQPHQLATAILLIDGLKTQGLPFYKFIVDRSLSWRKEDEFAVV